MRNKYLIPLALAATGLYLSTRETSTSDTGQTDGGGSGSPTGSGVIDPTITETEEATNLEPIVRGIGATITPSYKTWLRKDWSNYYKQLLQTMTVTAASNLVWLQWYDEQNFIRNLYTSQLALIFALTTYTDRPRPAGVGSNITWSSIPVYCDLQSYFNGSWSCWSCQDWLDWHRALEAKFGSTSQANQAWLSAWNQPENITTANSNSVWWFSWMVGVPNQALPPSYTCPDDCTFIEYFHSKGMDVATLFGAGTCALSNVAMAIIETVDSAGDVISSGANTISMLADFLPIAAAIYGGSWLYKQVKQ